MKDLVNIKREFKSYFCWCLCNIFYDAWCE